MTVLSDHEIWSLLASKRLVIDPAPQVDAVSPSAVDLTLDNRFTRLERVDAMSIDTRNSRAVMNAIGQLGQLETIGDSQPFTLAPDEFVLAWTRETIRLPNFLCARVEGRSTLARLGLSIHQTAPTVHATYANPLQLELRNGGPYKLQLYPGMPICQLIIEQLSSPSVNALTSIHTSRS